MQVKKFEAPTMQEALKVIKRELGPEAIILSTKHIKSGFGLMSKASVEVTAAIAEKELKKKNAAEKNLPGDVKEKIWNKPANKQAEIYDNYFERQLKAAGKSDRVELGIRQQAPSHANMQLQRAPVQPQRSAASAQVLTRSAAVGGNVATASAPTEARRYVDIPDEEIAHSRKAFTNTPKDSEKVQALQKDIENLRSIIEDLSQTKEDTGSAWVGDASLSDELNAAMQDLVASGVEKRFARQLIKQTAFELSEEEKSDEAAVLERLAYQLMRETEVKDILDGIGAVSGNPSTTVLAVVGPTGVGKTTTVAKIASLAILEKNLRVGLINLDSYKVAAAEQLSTYARIMGLPFRSVNSKDELQQALHDFGSLDLVILDTTGRSQKDQENLNSLKNTLGSIENLRSVLMISATTKDADLAEVFTRFRIFHPAGLVISKLDETSVYGCVFNAQKRTKLPLLYFTVGQRVPEDIEKASAERVADLILDL